MRRLFNIIKKGYKRFINWLKIYIRFILFIALMVILSIYVISNWDKCISMKFFEQFDGNNILFLVWLVLNILLFYDVEAKNFKLKLKHGVAEKRFLDVEHTYQTKQINNNNMMSNFQSQSTDEIDERSNNNELSEQKIGK